MFTPVLDADIVMHMIDEYVCVQGMNYTLIQSCIYDLLLHSCILDAVAFMHILGDDICWACIKSKHIHACTRC